MEASSAINALHPDDAGTDDAEAFFGGEDNGESSEPADAPLPDLTPEQQAESAEAYEKRTGHLPADAEERLAADAGQEQEQEPATDPSGARGAAEREYIVLQEVPLTEKALKHLLATIESGDQVRVAYFELDRTTARNVNGAIGAAYSTHKKVLGEKANMVAVSAKAFNRRKVEPKQKVETALSIS